VRKILRVIVATVLGAIFGIICYLGYSSKTGVVVDSAMIAGTIANRTLIGFVIGISGIKHWFWNGLIVGLVITLAMSIYPLIGGEWYGFLAFTGAGIIYGILIEVITSLVFKLKERF
jgi:hypothetical protein